jgi:putative ABC transport system ATP-binding protein
LVGGRLRQLGVSPLSTHDATTRPPAAALSVVVEDLSVTFGTQRVLDGLSLDIAAGEAVAIMGPSGSGKTSLFHCILGLRVPDSGSVWVGEHPVDQLHAADRSAMRRTELGLVFQSPHLLPELTVGENVAITRIFDGQERRQALEAADVCLGALGLAGMGGRGTDQLSGGEAQRVAVARALCRDEVGLVVADEPTASLDRATADLVTDLLVKQTKVRGVTLLVATHDPLVAGRCDRVLELPLLTARRGTT